MYDVLIIQIIGNSWRVVNTKDPVPLIVPTHLLGISFAYHTRREVYYSTQPMSTNTPYKLCLGNEVCLVHEFSTVLQDWSLFLGELLCAATFADQ